MHGYDVVDPTSISEELGGEAEFRALVGAAPRGGAGRDPRHRPEPHGGRRRQPLLDRAAREVLRRRSRRPGATGASSTSTTSPACARRTPRCSRRPTGWRSRSCATGAVDGLRIDHPDGLADPAGLPRAAARRGRRARVGGEDPRPRRAAAASWPVEGTVGYEFLNDVGGRCSSTRPARSASPPSGTSSPATPRPFSRLRRRGQAGAGLDHLRRGGRSARAPLPAATTCPRRSPRCPSTAPTSATATPPPEDREVLAEAGIEWLLDAPPEFVTRFQQTTPPVMAKGVEDTAFYRYLRLLALNDVGGDPGRFGLSVDGLPRRQRRARRRSTCSSPRRTTPSARATCGRGSARWPAWPSSGRRTCAAGSS